MDATALVPIDGGSALFAAMGAIAIAVPICAVLHWVGGRMADRAIRDCVRWADGQPTARHETEVER